MGETISTLVFRPPPPTYLRPNRYFFLDIEESETSSTFSCSSEPTKPTCPSHKIPAFFIKRRGARITFLFSHGNAEDLGMMYNRMKEMARVLGVNILAYDYSGYGHSTNSQPSEEKCYRNIDAAYKYLRTVRKIPASHIILYGRSLGSGPSCYLAAKTAQEGESVAGLILHSPFLSIYRIVVDCGMNLVGDIFKNINNAPKAKCPVLLIHGTRDEVVPFWHGNQLLQSFPQEYQAEPFWVESLGHNNIEVHAKKEYITRVTGFLNRYIPSNCNGAKSHIEVPTERYIQKSGKCWPIPEHERYNPQKDKDENKGFFVNSTWVKYGAEIVNEAIRSKKKREEARKKPKTPTARGLHNNIGTPTKISESNRVNSKPTRELFSQLQGKKLPNEPESNFLMIADDESTVSRFAMTRDRIVAEPTSENEEEEREDCEQNLLLTKDVVEKESYRKIKKEPSSSNSSSTEQDVVRRRRSRQSQQKSKHRRSKSPSRRRITKTSTKQ